MMMYKHVLTAVVVTTVQKLAVALMESFQKLIQIVKEYSNKPISIPVFSSLYKAVAGHDLTAFDAISLLIAIPTAIFTKIITGSASPQIPNRDSGLLDEVVFGNKSVEVTEQTKFDINTLTTVLTVSAKLVPTFVNLIKFFRGLANDGTGLTGSAFIEFFSACLTCSVH